MSEYDVSEAEFDRLFGQETPPEFGASGDGKVSEAEFDALFSRKPTQASGLERDLRDFRRVGLPADIAEKAARALKAGTYGTFEEAAVMCAPLARSHGGRLVAVDRGTLSAVVKERG